MKKIKYVKKRYFKKEGKHSIHGMDILPDIGCAVMPQQEYLLTNNMNENLDQAYCRLYVIYTNPDFIQRVFFKKLKIYLFSSLYSYKLTRNLYSKFKKIVE